MCAGHRAVVCPLIDHYATRTAQRLSGGSPFLESFYGRSAPVLLAAGRVVITPDPVYASTRWMLRGCRVS